jgi:hypothetical protein
MAMIPYRYSFSLDANPISITAEPEGSFSSADQMCWPVAVPHKISNSEPEYWRLAAHTETCTCEWTATLNWTSDGRKDTTTINNNGNPFRVAAGTRATVLKTWSWQ